MTPKTLSEFPEKAENLNTPDSNHFDALLALRGLACFMVVVIHTTPPRESITYMGYDLSWVIFSHGWVAVWIFFCLSGYLMGKAFFTERYKIGVAGTLNFWRNRILRIFPLYYFAVLLLALFVYPDILKIENWGYLLRLCTFTYNQSLPVLFAFPFWSLSTEIQFYIFVPFIYSLLRNQLRSPRQILCVSATIFLIASLIRLMTWISFYAQLHDQYGYLAKYWYSPLIGNIDIFMYGFLANAWIIAIKTCKTNKIDKAQKNIDSELEANQDIQDYSARSINIKVSNLIIKIVAIGLMVSLYIFSSYHFYFYENWNIPDHIGKGVVTATSFFVMPIITSIVTTFFILAFESDVYQKFQNHEKLSFNSILRNPLRVLEIFGHLSFGVYIWHRPIIDKISPIFTSSIPIESFYARLTAVIFFSCLFAAVTYFIIELPASRLKVYNLGAKDARQI